MKKNLLLLTLLLSMVSATTFAHDIEVKNSDGVTIYYVWTNNKTELEVSYRGSDYNSYSDEYSGNVVIPSSVTYNGSTYSVTSIGTYAFFNSGFLTSVTIPNSVKSIGNLAFSKCGRLASVHISDIAAWCKIAFSDLYSNPLYYAHHLYLGEEEITDLVIPNGVMSIGAYAFEDCRGLTSVTIPNSVTSIDVGAFYECSKLTSVTIPNSVTSIGSYAFSGCTALMTVKSYITEPFNINSFDDETYQNGTLYVPAGTKDLYLSFNGWKKFQKIEEMEEEPAPNGQCAKPRIIFAGKEIRFECETPGAMFESILTTEEQRFRGDRLVMDNEGIVYLLTVYAYAPGYKRSEPAQTGFFVSRSDVNQDGAVDVADIATIIDAMANESRENDIEILQKK